MKKYDFSDKEWNREDFRYVYSRRFPQIPRFQQEEDCIVNGVNLQNGDFDYISISTTKKYGTGTKLSTTCSFESYGAPLIVLSDDIRKERNGEWYYGVHIEIVLYENGINVWYLDLNPEVMAWKWLLRLEFPVTAEKEHLLSVELLDEALYINAEGIGAKLRIPGLPSEMYVGLTACEGINRFYDFTIVE